MPLNLPSFDALRQQARSHMQARIPGADVTLRRAVIPVIADTSASMSYYALQYLTWISRQIFPDTAESSWLARFAAIFGIIREPAVPAVGNVIFSGTAGIPVPLGTLLQLSDGSVEYQTTAAATIGSGGTVTVPVVATTPGVAGTAVAGAPLTLVVAIANVAPTATVDPNGLAGSDAETDASLLARTLLRVQQPPQGGSATDFEAWALDVPGVTRAWVYPQNRGIGTTDLCFVMDGRSNIIPLAADVAAVQAAVNAARPTYGTTAVFAPVPDPVNIIINNPVYTTAAATAQAAVQAALAALFTTTTPGGASIGSGIGAGTASLPPGFLAAEQITAAIASAPGMLTFDLVQPTTDIQSAHGHIAVLGSVSFE